MASPSMQRSPVPVVVLINQQPAFAFGVRLAKLWAASQAVQSDLVRSIADPSGITRRGIFAALVDGMVRPLVPPGGLMGCP